MTSTIRRIAMWSGPRNISTAMMRSWGNRHDTFVCDEPLYAHYLIKTGAPHPGTDAVIRSQENDWRKVVAWLTEYMPPGKTIFYQKHMTHHLLPEMDREWLGRVSSCFLIREPREVITSYVKKSPRMDLADSGFPQLVEIFDHVRAQSGSVPPVVDAGDVLGNPRRVLGHLCDALGLEFTDTMLSWPPGLRASDGVWAKHWYTEVEKSTSFQPYRPKSDPVPERFTSIYKVCLECYEKLHPYRLQ